MYKISPEVKIKAQKIKIIATDVDGVLTDGSVFIDEDGKEPLSRFNIYDGLGTIHARDFGIETVVISGRKSLCTEARCKHLGINYAYTGVKDKQKLLLELMEDLSVTTDQVAYIGDDVVDLKAMSLASLKVAPHNARSSIKEIADYVTSAKGGEGVLREVIDVLLECQGKYQQYIDKFR